MRSEDLAESSSQRRPRKPGVHVDSALSAACSASAPAAYISQSQKDGDTYMTYGDDEDEDEDEQSGPEPDDDESFCDGHHTVPHHSHLAELDFPHNTAGYASDDLGMSDAGAPLVNYLDVADLLTNDMDMDASDGPSSEFESSNDDDDTGYDAGESSSVQPSSSVTDESQSPDMHPLTTNPHVTDMFPHYPMPPPTLNPSAVSLQLEQLAAETADNGAAGAWFQDAHPVALTNPTPNTLGPCNYSLTDFLHHWARAGRLGNLQGTTRERGRCPWPARINEQAASPITHVQYADLEGDMCDFQGIDWDGMGVTRREARERRMLTYNNYVSRTGSDRWTPTLPDLSLPRTESFFRFRRMDIRRNVKLSHFQLRNVLATSSRTQAFYPGNGVVHSFNPVSGEGGAIMKLGDEPGSQISTLASEHGVLIAGGFNGEYILRHLDSDEPEETACHEGVITNNISGITNHVQIHQSRGSSGPHAAFSSNDMVFRVLDIDTETWLAEETFDYPLNCSAISPDRRLRVMVGDHYNVLITAAESTLPGGKPEILHELPGHRDFGFACDWADDGWTVATGFQDKAVKIWDARRWTDSSGLPKPVTTLRAEMAGVRSLRFSPVGSGKRVLVAAEEADVVSIIDAQTFRSKQTVDIFGEIGGISFTNEGENLMVLCCDRTRGGLLQLERCGVGREATWSDADDKIIRGCRVQGLWRGENGGSYDWPRSKFTEEKRAKHSLTQRRRRGADLDALEPF
ncbi:WD40-repeat-containing domain protein [Diplogelasinospora grovesii]|uniref:WD40-repeat-containing domain protein n=1 Tax=Diplogelasinospora grovesii TaxID=303347 RepID=A0AAN6NGF4_9PEZI|nr:WD40-repeat-containing domain protein [Diplogelasinospora grovesii]